MHDTHLLFPLYRHLFPAMDRSIGREVTPPQQVAQRARAGATKGSMSASRVGESLPSRNISELRQPASAPRERASASPLTPSILDFTRRTQMEAQAYRTAVRVGELQRQAVMGPGHMQ
jgi:hypothetical protein